MNAHALTTTDDRETVRLAYDSELELHCESEAPATARISDLSHDGARIEIGHYLSPGRAVSMRLNTVEMKGRVAWCRPMDHGSRFAVGVRFLGDEIERSFLTLSALVQQMAHV